MNRYMIWSSIAAILMAFAAPSVADDLNPQPEPPGVHKLTTTSHLTTSTIGSATGGAGSGKADTIGSATGGAGSGKIALRKAGGTQMNVITNAGATHGFNPQPDPPGDTPIQVQGQIPQ